MARNIKIGYIIVVGIIIAAIVAIVLAASNKQFLKSIGIDFKFRGASASARIEYQEERTKEDGKYNYTTRFYSPLGAEVKVNTVSSDTVAVTSVTQENDKTIIVLEPIDK